MGRSVTAVLAPDVDLRPWAADDLPLMERLLGDPAMTEHLGGPETPARLRSRLDGYLAMEGGDKGAMFVIVAGPDRTPAGSVGYWEHAWREELCWETGWSVLPEFQGRGIATVATGLTVARARRYGKRRPIHAFPSVRNGPSNAICRKVGFRLVGERDFEYPKGNQLRCNDWVRDVPLPADLAKPAVRALERAGLTNLEQLVDVSEAEVRRMHGVGANAVERLRRALAAQGLSFAAGEPSRGSMKGDS